MSIAAVVEALMQTGATQEMILAAIKAIEYEKEKSIKAKRDRDAERQRRHRMSRDVTVTSVTHSDSCDPPLNGSNGFPDPSLTSLIPPKERTPIGVPKKAPQKFAEWYALYPHKIGRAAAERSYARAAMKATPAELLDGLERYISTKPPDREYCNPTTWLNQERWKDEPAENQVNATQEGKPKFKAFTDTSFDQKEAIDRVFKSLQNQAIEGDLNVKAG